MMQKAPIYEVQRDNTLIILAVCYKYVGEDAQVENSIKRIGEKSDDHGLPTAAGLIVGVLTGSILVGLGYHALNGFKAPEHIVDVNKFKERIRKVDQIDPDFNAFLWT